MRALQTWPRDGIPDNPVAWLRTTARRGAVDLIRREAARAPKEALAAGPEPLVLLPDEEPEPAVVEDDLLRLVFTCCHPSLAPDTRVALALRTLCGLTTGEVARALLVSEATMAKRLTRARQKIRVAGIPYRVPVGRGPPRPLGHRAGDDVPAVQRGLRGDRRPGADPTGARRRGAPPHPAAAPVAARRPGGHGAARPDPPAGLAPRRPHGCRGLGRAARRPGPHPLGPRRDRRGGPARGGGAAPVARPPRPVRRAGRHRRLPRPRALVGGDRLGGHRVVVRRAAPHRRRAGRSAQPRGGGRRGSWPGRGPGPRRGDRRAVRVPALARDPCGPAAPARPDGGGRRGGRAGLPPAAQRGAARPASTADRRLTTRDLVVPADNSLLEYA